MTIRVGHVLYGFCDGFFGRDSYDQKQVEAIGVDWIVARDTNGIPLFASFEGSESDVMDRLLHEWSKENK